MKIVTKIISITLITILFILNIPLYSKAFSLDDIISGGDSFISQTAPKGTSIPDTIQPTELTTVSDMVSGVLLTIAVAVTLISAVVMGINFTIQSVEDKAKIKESMVPWIIGIIVSFGAYGIWKITMSVFYNL